MKLYKLSSDMHVEVYADVIADTPEEALTKAEWKCAVTNWKPYPDGVIMNRDDAWLLAENNGLGWTSEEIEED